MIIFLHHFLHRERAPHAQRRRPRKKKRRKKPPPRASGAASAGPETSQARHIHRSMPR